MVDELYVERTVSHPTMSHGRPREGRDAASFPRSGGPKCTLSLPPLVDLAIEGGSFRGKTR